MTLLSFIWLLVWILIVVALVYLALWLIDMVFSAIAPAGQPQPTKVIKILKVIVIVIAVLIVITWLIGVIPPPPGLSWGRIG